MQETFIKYINYLEAEKNASPYTVRNYRNDLLDFFHFLKAEGVASLKEVNRHTLRDYMSYLMEQGIVKRSIARKLSAIRSFYRYLIREGTISASPVAATTSPKLDKRLPSFLTPEEIRKLLEAPDLTTPQGQRGRALLELLYASGLRVSELVNLNLAHVNLDTREALVHGKGSKERVVLMGKPAADALSNYIRQGRTKLLDKKTGNALFINRYGTRITERSIQRMLEEYTNKAGIDRRVHPHMLRHTFATHMLDGGADLRVVQELLGHADLSSTQIYTHVTKSRARKVYMSAHPLAREKSNEPDKQAE
jgi:integrase/recombinase XerC